MWRLLEDPFKFVSARTPP